MAAEEPGFQDFYADQYERLRREFFLSPRTGTFTNDGKRLAISDGTGSVFVWRTSNR